MSDKLETYLEEISHFLSGRAEREEILSEIRSHILEKAAEEHRRVHGRRRPRQGHRRLTARPARSPRDTSTTGPSSPRPTSATSSATRRSSSPSTPLLTVVAVVFKKDFIIFPFLFMPRLGVIEALMYLPTAFLADLGIVTARPLLHHPERQGHQAPLAEARRRPRRDQAADEGLLGEPHRHGRRSGRHAGHHRLRPLSLRPAPHHLLRQPRSGTNPRPLFTPGAGRRLSIIVIAMFAASTMTLLVKLFTRSRWVDMVSNVVSLALIGLMLRQPFDNLFAVEHLRAAPAQDQVRH